MEYTKYWDRIKINIENLYLKKSIKQNYSYNEFCNDFKPCETSLDIPLEDKCICDHKIKHNYTYMHIKNNDVLILGSCCIKKFSTMYKNKRTCIDCNITIRKNVHNYCVECRLYRKIQLEKQKAKEAYIESCRCYSCGYLKKDNKYKYCYLCYKK
jgi:hypothetical protein